MDLNSFLFNILPNKRMLYLSHKSEFINEDCICMHLCYCALHFQFLNFFERVRVQLSFKEFYLYFLTAELILFATMWGGCFVLATKYQINIQAENFCLILVFSFNLCIKQFLFIINHFTLVCSLKFSTKVLT
jgi:hypothetical protein